MSGLWIWLGLAGILVIVEVLTVDLIFFMLAAGCVGGAVAYGLGLGTPLQIVIAAVIAVIGLAFVRPIAMKHLKQRGHTATNVDALIGKEALVLNTVTATSGLVKVQGEQWSARLVADDGAPVAEGAKVVIESIDGVYLKVVPQ